MNPALIGRPLIRVLVIRLRTMITCISVHFPAIYGILQAGESTTTRVAPGGHRHKNPNTKNEFLVGNIVWWAKSVMHRHYSIEKSTKKKNKINKKNRMMEKKITDWDNLSALLRVDTCAGVTSSSWVSLNWRWISGQPYSLPNSSSFLCELLTW